MSDEGGVTAAALDNDDLLGEILLRLSPLPTSLPRASVVSKRWELLATDPDFRRRFLAHHRKPPILGVFEQRGRTLVFTSVLDPPDRIPPARFDLPDPGGLAFDSWTLPGCRHGFVLILFQRLSLILMFDPISVDVRALAIPPGFGPRVEFPPDYTICACTISAAVLCDAGSGQGHVHGDCHMSPFKLAVVGTFSGGQHPAVARLYSSKTGIWRKAVWTPGPCAGIPSSCIRIIRAEGGGVGMAVLSYPSFQMWGRTVSNEGVATWMLQKTVNMHDIIGLPSGLETSNEVIVGYSEDADVVFISVSSNSEHYTFVVQLESMKSRKLNQNLLENSYHPFANFYTGGTDGV
ncbi:uncharacterized protein [Lolium perenne]|uniref:uncharacterized protein isoform X2 n=1 Tax=Lolium perenne TaxID=4522 RepID=UPI003A9A0A4B